MAYHYGHFWILLAVTIYVVPDKRGYFHTKGQFEHFIIFRPSVLEYLHARCQMEMADRYCRAVKWGYLIHQYSYIHGLIIESKWSKHVLSHLGVITCRILRADGYQSRTFCTAVMTHSAKNHFWTNVSLDKWVINKLYRRLNYDTNLTRGECTE